MVLSLSRSCELVLSLSRSLDLRVGVPQKKSVFRARATGLSQKRQARVRGQRGRHRPVEEAARVQELVRHAVLDELALERATLGVGAVEHLRRATRGGATPGACIANFEKPPLALSDGATPLCVEMPRWRELWRGWRCAVGAPRRRSTWPPTRYRRAAPTSASGPAKRR